MLLGTGTKRKGEQEWRLTNERKMRTEIEAGTGRGWRTGEYAQESTEELWT